MNRYDDIPESFGGYLRRERELREIPLEEISSFTRINIKALKAIEQDDFSALPPLAFVRAFIRCYADYIGLNIPDVMLRFDTFVQNKYPELTGEVPVIKKKPKQKQKYVPLALAILVVLILVLAYWWRSSPSPEGPAPEPTVSGAETEVTDKGLATTYEMVMEAAGEEPEEETEPSPAEVVAENTGEVEEEEEVPPVETSGEDVPEETIETENTEIDPGNKPSATEPESEAGNEITRPEGDGEKENLEAEDDSYIYDYEVRPLVSYHHESLGPSIDLAVFRPRSNGHDQGARPPYPDIEHRVTMEIKEGQKCWIQFVIDGDEPRQTIIGPGQEVTFEAIASLRIKFGKPEAIKYITHNDRPYEVDAECAPWWVSFPPRPGENLCAEGP